MLAPLVLVLPIARAACARYACCAGRIGRDSIEESRSHFDFVARFEIDLPLLTHVPNMATVGIDLFA